MSISKVKSLVEKLDDVVKRANLKERRTFKTSTRERSSDNSTTRSVKRWSMSSLQYIMRFSSDVAWWSFFAISKSSCLKIWLFNVKSRLSRTWSRFVVKANLNRERKKSLSRKLSCETRKIWFSKILFYWNASSLSVSFVLMTSRRLNRKESSSIVVHRRWWIMLKQFTWLKWFSQSRCRVFIQSVIRTKLFWTTCNITKIMFTKYMRLFFAFDENLSVDSRCNLEWIVCSKHNMFLMLCLFTHKRFSLKRTSKLLVIINVDFIMFLQITYFMRWRNRNVVKKDEKTNQYVNDSKNCVKVHVVTKKSRWWLQHAMSVRSHHAKKKRWVNDRRLLFKRLDILSL